MEDQEIMDQFLEHRQQNYVIDNMNAVAGCGGIEVADVVGSGEILGVKYDEQLQTEEHDVGDDDEWKYVKEVQQSEKQQSVKDFGDYSSNELAENEEATYKYEIGNGAAGLGDVKDVENVMNVFGNTNSNGHEVHKAENHMLEDLDIRPTNFNITAPLEICSSQDAVSVEQPELGDDEDPSSIATNGTSSLSENVVPNIENKGDYISLEVCTQQRLDADIEQTQWQLNPEAKEFVPNFGSNPTSPISPHRADFPDSNIENTIEKVCFFGQASAAVPHRIMADDDFVAQSPRKGRCGNMDTIALPAEQEFDEEADRRPHELEQDGVEQLDMVVDNKTSVETTNQASKDDIVGNDNIFQCDDNVIDVETSKIIDHGPETCVDLDADISKQQYKELSTTENDIMKQSIYVTNDEPIEDVLNSVQPIPTEIDSANNSFTEELHSNDLAGDKEQLQVEEKEHVSNSPSTEEMQTHLQCLHSSNKDNSQTPNDINDDVAMQGSFYIEENKPINLNNDNEGISSLPPMLGSDDISNCSIENRNPDSTNSESCVQSPDALPFGIDEQPQGESDDVTLASYTDEKHLIEETKEIPVSYEDSDLEHEMTEFTLCTDGHLSQAEEVAASSAVTAVKDKSGSFKKPDDIGEICEQITMTGNRIVENPEYELEQEIIQDKIESPKILQDVENELIVSASTAVTVIDDKSGCFNKPDDIGEICEQIPTTGNHIVENPEYELEQEIIQDKIESPKILQDAENEFIVAEEPICNAKHSSNLFSTINPEEKEDFSSVVAEDFPSANISEDLAYEERTISQTENISAPTDVGRLPTASLSVLFVKAETNETENIETTENPLDMPEEDEQRNIEDTSIAHVQSHVDELAAKVDDGITAEKNIPEDFKCLVPTISPVENINSPFTFESISTPTFPALLVEPEGNEPESIKTLKNELCKLEDEESTIEYISMETHVESNIDELSTKVVDVATGVNNMSEDLIYEIPSISPVEIINAPLALESLSATASNALSVNPEINETENVETINNPLDKTEEGEQSTIEDSSMEAHVESSIDEITAKVVDYVTAVKTSDNNQNITVPTLTTKIISHTATKKPDDFKKAAPKTACGASKTKLSSALTYTAKKPTALEAAKKPIGVAAKPRLPPPKSTVTDKKPIKPTPVCATTTRKVIGSATTVTKVASKTSTTSSSTRSASTTISATKTMQSKPTAATRTINSATAARKPVAAPSTTTAKPRSASGVTSAPAKPTYLGVSGTNGSTRTKVTSPRCTLTSQVRKITPVPMGAKSPVKSTTSNSMTKAVTSTLGNRTKAPSSNIQVTGSATMTKTFSARPAPKVANSATTTSTTTRRLTVGGTTTSITTTTQTTSKATGSTLRKSSPIKPTAGKTPTKAINSISGAKTAKSTTKASPNKSNGDGNNKESELNGTVVTSPLVFTMEDQENADPIIPNVNDPSTLGQDSGSTEHIQVDLIAA